jgi:site-specific DNA recombinase
MDERLCDIFCNEYAKFLAEMHRQHNDSLSQYRVELRKCQKEDTKMVQAICDGFASPELKVKMNANTARIEHLEKLLSSTKELPALMEPSMARHYRAEVKDLIRSLNDPDSRTESADKLRALMDKIVLTPKQHGYGLDIDLHGSLAGILTVASKHKDKAKRAEIIQQVVSVAEGCDRYDLDMQETVVAGAGFEPAAFRL